MKHSKDLKHLKKKETSLYNQKQRTDKWSYIELLINLNKYQDPIFIITAKQITFPTVKDFFTFAQA